MPIKPMIRNNICINAHAAGCAKETERQIEYVVQRRASYDRLAGPRSVLVVGCSTGYGLASRIAAAFGFGAATVGVSFEKEPSASGSSTGTPGWYNNRAFDASATADSLPSITIDGDAYSAETKERVIAAARELGLRFDLVVYSLASPVRVDPKTGVMHRSVIKPIGQPYRGRTVDAFTGELSYVDVQPATETEIEDTVKVMGGEDWELWIEALAAAGVLARGAMTVAYSYIGPSMTWPIYRDGTIGRAKLHLEGTAARLPASADRAANSEGTGFESLGLRAFVSVNKALVTRASSVIPVIPLYMSILFKVMKERGIHEGCIEQMDRLFRERLYLPQASGLQSQASGLKAQAPASEPVPVPVDEEGRIRIDELEMGQAVQAEVEERFRRASPANLSDIADIESFRLDFLRTHGFEVEDVDYEAEIDTSGSSLAAGAARRSGSRSIGAARGAEGSRTADAAWRTRASTDGALI